MPAAGPLPALAPVTHRRARREESLLCSLVSESGAAGERSTATVGLLRGDGLPCSAAAIWKCS